MNEINKKLRINSLILSNSCKDGNLQSVFSCIDILWELYDKIMNWNKEIANSEHRDYLIISKGQATLALYPILIEKGLFSFNEVDDNIGKFDSKFCIQTDITKFKGGIENSAGSLGHGLPFATGIAFANKINNSHSKTFVLCGDGEFCEGTMWESCIFASTKKLDNLIVIIDDNNSVKNMVRLENLKERLEIFGFDTIECDGHNEDEILKAFDDILNINNNKPKAIIAKTIRGYGSKTMMENDIWFHKSPSNEELPLLIKEVESF